MINGNTERSDNCRFRRAGGRKSAILGVSIGNEHYYNRKRLRLYLEWARGEMERGRFGAFAFLIGDNIHKYDYVVFHNVSLEAAEQRCMEIGGRIGRAVKRSIRATHVPANVVHWQTVEHHSVYPGVLRSITSAYDSDNNFREEIESQVQQYIEHAEIYAKMDIDEKQLERTGKLELLKKYLLYEIAGLIVLAEYMDYPILVYPSEDLVIFDDIYSGEYPAIRECLPEHPRREFIEQAF